jgi:hypothetical protein
MNTPSTHAHRRKQTILSLCLIVCGLAAATFSQRSYDHARHANRLAAPEELYVSSQTAEMIIPRAFRGLVADWYWMRSLQYLGGKIVAEGDNFNFGDLGTLDLRLLPPLVETAARLDPQFMQVYEYAAMILPDVDRAAALRVIDHGIAANPGAWRLYHHRGYILWQAKDFAAAREAYLAGSRVAGAREWMRTMAARMEGEGGSRALAREMYARIYNEADDEQVKRGAMLNTLRLQYLDERDIILPVLARYTAGAARARARGAKWQSNCAATG